MADTLGIIERAMTFSTSSWALAYHGELSVHGMFPTEQTLVALQMKILKGRERLVPTMTATQRSEFYRRKERVQREFDAERNDLSFYEVESIRSLNAMWAGLVEHDKEPEQIGMSSKNTC